MNDTTVGEERARAFSEWWRGTGEAELRQILFWVWDPLGLNREFPDAADEYDKYALEILTALASEATPAALAALLGSIEQNRMGLDPRPLNDDVSRLSRWHRRSVERYQSHLPTVASA